MTVVEKRPEPKNAVEILERMKEIVRNDMLVRGKLFDQRHVVVNTKTWTRRAPSDSRNRPLA